MRETNLLFNVGERKGLQHQAHVLLTTIKRRSLLQEHPFDCHREEGRGRKGKTCIKGTVREKVIDSEGASYPPQQARGAAQWREKKAPFFRKESTARK